MAAVSDKKRLKRTKVEVFFAILHALMHFMFLSGA